MEKEDKSIVLGIIALALLIIDHLTIFCNRGFCGHVYYITYIATIMAIIGLVKGVKSYQGKKKKIAIIINSLALVAFVVSALINYMFFP